MEPVMMILMTQVKTSPKPVRVDPASPVPSEKGTQFYSTPDPQAIYTIHNGVGSSTRRRGNLLKENLRRYLAGDPWRGSQIRRGSYMGGYFNQITDEQADLIRSSEVFFIATADPELRIGPKNVGPINLSPKGATPLHILTPNRVAYLDYTGSGNETARHAAAGGPVTIMVCSFGDADAAIVRLYGKACAIPFEESPIAERLFESPAAELKLPPRQVIEVEVEQTQTSCGYGVPLMSFARERRVADRGRRFKDAAQFKTKNT